MHDANQGDGVASGKLGGIAVFGDTTERVRGCDGHGGASNFFGIKFELASGNGGPKGG